MAVGTAIHYVGSVLLLAAMVLLVVVSVTSPVVNDLALMSVTFDRRIGQAEKLTFGTFGYCVINFNAPDDCHRHLGYHPADVISSLTNSPAFSSADRDSTRILTHVFVLHPVAAGLAFLAFLLSLATNLVTSLASAVLAFLAFVATIIALGSEFAAFAIVKHHVNRGGGGANSVAAHARWGRVIWCVVAAGVGTLLASVLVFFTCLAGRRKSRKAGSPHSKLGRRG
ncbi:pH-response regulator protein palI/prr-5 [Escovopsis weberi]|uniref:pH-response regulator protein palI/prr-5 n=1 Tax=Escovopsis weberi TaxID=150374 RepID=A0A0M8MWJ5_ESCWE|nr:pH-response regulator protein palI/prr-5 [Escovopsis weberi]